MSDYSSDSLCEDSSNLTSSARRQAVRREESFKLNRQTLHTSVSKWQRAVRGNYLNFKTHKSCEVTSSKLDSVCSCLPTEPAHWDDKRSNFSMSPLSLAGVETFCTMFMLTRYSDYCEALICFGSAVPLIFQYITSQNILFVQITKQTSHNSSFQQLLYYRINGEQDYYTGIASRSEKLNSPMSMRFHSEICPSPPLNTPD